MIKWFLRISFLSLVLVAGLLFYAKSYLTINFLVEKLEENINSRVQIGGVSVNFTGELELTDVYFSERDSFVETKVLHDDRESLVDGAIIVDSLGVSISLSDILSRTLTVKHITLAGMKVDMAILEDGSSTLEKLFAKPAGSEKVAKVEVEKKEEVKAELPQSEPKTLNAQESSAFITKIETIDINSVDFTVLVKKTKLELKGRDLFIHVTDINVDPNALATVNVARFLMGGVFDVKSLEENVNYGHLELKGEAELSLFNSESGDLEPDVNLTMIVERNSSISTRVPYINKIWKVTDQLATLGVKKVKMKERVDLKKNQQISVRYNRGEVSLVEDFVLSIEDWKIKALAGSGFHIGTGSHEAKSKIIASKKVSQKAIRSLKKSGKVGKILSGLSGENGGGLLPIEDGKIVIPVSSTGSLSDPKMSYKSLLSNPLKKGLSPLKKVLKDRFKKEQKKVLKGALDKLFR